LNQVTWVTVEGVPTQPLLGESPSHYAIDLPPPGRVRSVGFDLQLTKDPDRELPRSWVRSYPDGSKVEFDIAWEWSVPDEATLVRMADVAAVIPIAQEAHVADLDGGQPAPLATGSNSRLFYSQGAPGPCVYAYNYRNTSTGYFRASSEYRGNCYYMWVTLWGGSKVTNDGSCLITYWLGSGPYKAAQLSSKYVYTNAADTCSNHFGWSADWLYWVEFAGLDDGV